LLSDKAEQRVNMKFLAKLGRASTETYSLLVEVYGDECLSRTQVFEWFRRFKMGKEEIEDDLRPCRPSMLSLKKSVKSFEKNHCLSIRTVTELGNIDKERDRFYMNILT
jgi:hypothetical protein